MLSRGRIHSGAYLDAALFLFGAYSGFDTIEECFEDLTPHIHALETGLSSDPAMNWRLSALDGYTLVSNSDAHSPPTWPVRQISLTAASYADMRQALAHPDTAGFGGTLEFFPGRGQNTIWMAIAYAKVPIAAGNQRVWRRMPRLRAEDYRRRAASR